MRKDWDYDWQCAVECSGVLRWGDIATVERHRDGQNDGDPWLAMGTLKGGRWFFLSAWCDYTGWGCQDGGHCEVSHSRDELIRLCMGDDERAALLGGDSVEGPWFGFEQTNP